MVLKQFDHDVYDHDVYIMKRDTNIVNVSHHSLFMLYIKLYKYFKF